MRKESERREERGERRERNEFVGYEYCTHTYCGIFYESTSIITHYTETVYSLLTILTRLLN